MALINQYYHPPNLDDVFQDAIKILDLNEVFTRRRARFNKRTSSACWDTPMLKPSGMPILHWTWISGYNGSETFVVSQTSSADVRAVELQIICIPSAWQL